MYWLDRNFSEEEVKLIAFNSGSNRVLGPHGFPVTFLHYLWEEVKCHDPKAGAHEFCVVTIVVSHHFHKLNQILQIRVQGIQLINLNIYN